MPETPFLNKIRITDVVQVVCPVSSMFAIVVMHRDHRPSDLMRTIVIRIFGASEKKLILVDVDLLDRNILRTGE